MKITKKDLNRNLKISYKIYHTLAIIKEYCNNMQHYEQVANLTPIMHYLHNEADKIYFNLTNLKENIDERAC